MFMHINLVKIKWEVSQVIVICRWCVCSPSTAFMVLLLVSEKYSWNRIRAALALLLTQGLDF